MLRTVWKKCLLLAALMVAGMMLSASPAEAGWGHQCSLVGCGWSGYGYSSAYAYTTSFCSPCVTGWGSSWYNPNWGCYSGWYSGSSWYNPNWGCYSGYYNSYYTPGYGSYGVASGCCNSVVVGSQAGMRVPYRHRRHPRRSIRRQRAGPGTGVGVADSSRRPARFPRPPTRTCQRPGQSPLPPPPGDASRPTAGIRLPASATLFTVVVPEDAQVYVNGMLTKTPGTQRQSSRTACNRATPTRTKSEHG